MHLVWPAHSAVKICHQTLWTAAWVVGLEEWYIVIEPGAGRIIASLGYRCLGTVPGAFRVACMDLLALANFSDELSGGKTWQSSLNGVLFADAHELNTLVKFCV